MDTTTKTVSEYLDEVYNELLSTAGLVIQIRKGEHGSQDYTKVHELYKAVSALSKKCGYIDFDLSGEGWLHDLYEMTKAE